jgi:flagellar M-ring protein FliF
MEKRQYNSGALRSHIDNVRNWPSKKKISLGLALCIALTAVVLLIHLYRISGYQLLYGGLTSGEVVTLSRWLDSRKIDYKTDHESGNLYVSSGLVHKVRTEMAEQRVWQYPKTGHEIVDPARLAPLEPLGGNAYAISLQRELARTIEAFDSVSSAQVHLRSYHRGTTADSSRDATVVLTIEPGKKLLPTQLQAISRLISGAVADLSPGRIRIVSSTGTVLLRGSGYVGDELYAADTLSYQRNVEQILEQRALEVIQMLIGSGPAHVTVAADINFANSETISERFDPTEPVIKKEESSQRIADANSGGSDTTPPAQDAYSGAVSSDSKLEYEINKTTSKIEKPAGTIERLTVTMLLPEKTLQFSGSDSSYLPLSSEQIEKIKAAVSAVVALKPERGDAIYLSTIPLASNSGAIGASEASSGIDLFAYLPLARISLLAAGFLLTYLFLVRPILSILKQENSHTEDTGREQEPRPEEEPVNKSEDLALSVKEEILSNPAPAAHIVRKWMKETW